MELTEEQRNYISGKSRDIRQNPDAWKSVLAISALSSNLTGLEKAAFSAGFQYALTVSFLMPEYARALLKGMESADFTPGVSDDDFRKWAEDYPMEGSC